MHLIDGRPKDTFTGYIENYTVQFNIYDEGTSDNNVDTIFGLLTALFDYCTLTVTGYTFIIMRRIMNNGFHNDEEDIWQENVQYEIEMQKN
jgi:hypothetical protein